MVTPQELPTPRVRVLSKPWIPIMLPTILLIQERAGVEVEDQDHRGSVLARPLDPIASPFIQPNPKVDVAAEHQDHHLGPIRLVKRK